MRRSSMHVVAMLLSLTTALGATAIAQRLELVVDGLDRPLGVTHAADGSSRLFVIEQGGTVRVVADGVLLETPFLDIRDRVRAGGEQGLLGLAFPSGNASRGTFYVAYTDRAGTVRVARFSAGGDPNVADPDSEQLVLLQEQPFANHNGGHVAFGPDGYLYVGFGDGGGGGDPLDAGQDLGTWLGAILRVDVTRAGTYRVPPDNPFVDRGDALPEIWAWGLRNPWRFSFDRETGDLWIGDVGQNRFEEANLEPAGSPGGVNYGWNTMEGPECFGAPDCDRAGMTPPVLAYRHDSGWGRSITGGFVYRGEALRELAGAYIFADFASGRVFRAVPDGAGGWEARELLDTGLGVASFGEDEAGELYLVDLRGGGLYRLVP